MDLALSLARDKLGCVAPNPAVGCIIVKNGTVIGEGATAPGGRPHAEYLALQKVGSAAKVATVYVTLEPCAHEGETPSCARLLVEAGVSRVIIALEDPDPRTSGGGAKMMEAAGIDVEFGLLEDAARRLNQGFFLWHNESRPMVTLKIATSKDAKVAWPQSHLDKGGGKWITGKPARQHGHGLRANHDAILVGIGTALADDPMLTCRLEGKGSPIRIVLDHNSRLDPSSKLVKTAGQVPTWLIHQDPLSDGLSGTFIRSISMDDMSDVAAILGCLRDTGITRLLVEGGPTVWCSFLDSGLVDHLYWYKAPIEIGVGGVQISDDFGHQWIEEKYGLIRRSEEKLGDDMLVNYEKRR